MIFQDPFASLNPRMTVGSIIAEPMHIFGLHTPARPQARSDAAAGHGRASTRGSSTAIRTSSPAGSGSGSASPGHWPCSRKLIVCDEPVSALDVSIQAQVINLLMDLQQQLGLAYVFIAHDLSVVRHISHRIGVMYLGRIVELADAEELYTPAAASLHAGPALRRADSRSQPRTAAAADHARRRSPLARQRATPAARSPTAAPSPKSIAARWCRN